MDHRTVFFTGVFLMLLMVLTRTAADVTVHHAYHFINTPKTWSEAQHFCRLNYDDLATIDNIEDHKQLMQSVGSADVTNIWIGLERSTAHRWVWSEGIGEVAAVFNWHVSLSYSGCVVMMPAGDWNTYSCGSALQFICFKYDSDGKETYFLNTTSLSWRDAQSFCRQHYTDLVSVKTTAQNTEINSHGNGILMWIGLSRDFWMWSDRNTSSFRNWAENDPDNIGGDENCAVTRKDLQYRWQDIACHNSLPFVCYGGRKMRRTLVKVRLSSGASLNLPAESDSLLQQFQARLEEQGVTEVKVSWQADRNQQIFRREQDNSGAKITGC